MNKVLLELRNLHTEFHTHFGTVQAVRGISFSMKEGETLGIVGESGCGKTVSGLSILRLIPDPPGKITQGEIIFHEENLLSIPKRELTAIRGKKIAMIFQDPISSLNPVLNIRTQMLESLLYHTDISKKEAESECLRLLNRVRIRSPKNILSSYPHQLSGGMRQRIMIAIAISCKPDLLIADEPTTSLDVTVQAQILKLLYDIQREMNSSILLITHNLAVVAGMCQRVLVFYAGKIVEDASVDSLFKNPLHPYTQGLLKAVPSLRLSREKNLQTIDGAPPDLLKPPPGCAFHPRCQHAMKVCAQLDPVLMYAENHAVACWLYDSQNPGRKFR
jgi:oligopeptide/dipeptide ABC transporter ATP-binding protein